MSVIFLFIDGVGMGGESASNPFWDNSYSGFASMCGGQPFTAAADDIEEPEHLFLKVDARLGVEGLPQSGTGQTALFTGKNAAKEIGKHFGPFPHSGIKHFLREQSLFHRAAELQKKAHFINAYPDIFFEKSRKRNRWSCTTLMTRSAGLPLNRVEEVKKGEAVTAELTQRAWREQLNIDVPVITPMEAADRLLVQAADYDLLLHEYYLTDKAGHSREMEKAARYLNIYDRFLSHLIEHKKPTTTLVLSSDHGNVEDLSEKTHTLNPVPLFALGPGANQFAGARSIMDVTPGILRILRQEDGE